MNHLPYLLSISVSLFDKLKEGSWAESSIFVVKIIRLLYSVNMFIWIANGKYITAIKYIDTFFIYLDRTDDFRLIQKKIWLQKRF